MSGELLNTLGAKQSEILRLRSRLRRARDSRDYWRERAKGTPRFRSQTLPVYETLTREIAQKDGLLL